MLERRTRRISATESDATRRAARLGVLLYALFALAAVVQSMIVPLLPALSRKYGLPASTAALLVALPSLGTLAVSIPAGILADRFGSRLATLAAGAVLCLSTAIEGLPSLACLLLGRLGMGVAFGIVWTTGVAWQSQMQSEAGSARLGALVTSSAVGLVAGPAVGGAFAEIVGLGAPFLLIGGLLGAIVALLWWEPAPAPREPAAGSVALRPLIRAVWRQPGVLSGASGLGIAGAVNGALQLLIPVALERNGVSSGGIGLAFSLTAALYIVVSAAVVRQGRRAITTRITTTAALVLAMSPLPAVTSTETLALVAALMLCTVPRAVVATTAYPLATADGARAGIRDGIVLGTLNAIWAAGMVFAPLLAGAVDQAAGPRSAYLVAIVPGMLASAWLLARGRRAASAPTPAHG